MYISMIFFAPCKLLVCVFVCDPSFDFVFCFGKFVPGFWFFGVFTIFSWYKICLVSVKQVNFIYAISHYL